MHQILAMAVLAAAVLAPQDKGNPQYDYWANCKPGSWVKNRMEMENQGQKIEYESVTRLLEVTPEKVVVESLLKMKTGDKTVDSPPRRSEIKASDKQQGKTVNEKDEEITVAGRTLQCRYYEVVTEAAEKKPKMTVKAWMSKEIPGGAAKSEVTSEQMKGPIRTTALEWEKK
jgi:hypothetical protein